MSARRRPSLRLLHTAGARAAACATVLAVLLSACGLLPARFGGTDTSPITVMTWAPWGTGATRMPGMPAMAQAYAKWVNAHGGLGGHPLQVLTCNEQDSPTEAAGCARRAVSHHVVAVVGSYSRYARDFLGPLELNDIPYLGGYGVSAEEFDSPLSYPVNGGAATVLAGNGVQLARGCDRVAVVRPDSVEGDQMPSFVAAGLRAAHHSGVRDVPAPEDATDYAPQARRALTAAEAGSTAGGSGCVTAALGEDTGTFFDAYQRLAPSGTGSAADSSSASSPVRVSSVLGSVSQSLVNQLGGSSGPLADALVTGWYPPVDDRRWAPMRKVVQDYAFDDDRIDPGDSGVQTTWIAYTVLRAVVGQMQAQGVTDITASALQRTLDRGGKAVSTGGLTPPLRWRRQDLLGVPGYPRIVNALVTLQTVRDGRLVASRRGFVDVTRALQETDGPS
ncbi:ABC transporter substrate-binding protein [Streptomyces sp. NPDC059740]|uniref:ABC transporter substrate-binding protein n=1 Tax=Streptomyces sp. NPDC059740 TaxID=3346926 RepID=UPI00365F7082